MRKWIRFLAPVLAALLVLSAAATVSAARSYDLTIAGVQITDDNKADVLGNGVFSYDPLTNRLTVKGNYDSKVGYVIAVGVPNQILYVAEDARLSAAENVIVASRALTITGPGKLTLRSANGCGVYADSGAIVTIENARVDASGSYGISGNRTQEYLEIRDSAVHAAGSSGAIARFDGGVTLEGCLIEGQEITLGADGFVDKNGAAAKEVSLMEPGDSGPVNPFVDVRETDRYYFAVIWAYYAEPQVTNGTDATHFSPFHIVTRGQAVTFLWRAMGEPEPKTKGNPFADVPESAYYRKAVLWAVERGITNGTDAAHFSPDQTCSTAHIITFLYRTLGVGKNGWYEEAARWAQGVGLLEGVPRKVAPDVSCPRGDMVLFLCRQLSR
ncbi:MAG: S-layer homology domain-containing protein [Oscillospiraceae bacterium]|nr:S-layer homology domain-containing protein [Oscillospiraceae bacterium]